MEEKTEPGAVLFSAKPTNTDSRFGHYYKSIILSRKRKAILISFYLLGIAICTVLLYCRPYLLQDSYGFRKWFLELLPVFTVAYVGLLFLIVRDYRSESFWEARYDDGPMFLERSWTADKSRTFYRQCDLGNTHFAEIEAYDTWLKVFTPQGPKSFRRIRYDTLVVVWITKDVIILRSCTGPDIDDVTDVMIDRHSFTKGTPDTFIARLQPYLRHAKTSYKGKSEGVRQTSRWADPNYFFKQRHVKQFGLHTVDLGE